jgi:uroporphyrinogen-III synthase
MPGVAENALSSHSGLVAITSAEAVYAVEQLGPALVPHLGKTVFAVGKATAERAKTAEFETVQTSEGKATLPILLPTILMA